MRLKIILCLGTKCIYKYIFILFPRSAEAILNHILKRAKKLYEEGYQFKIEPVHFHSFFKEEVQLEDYLALDENILLTYFQFWMNEEDAILKDLCRRFVNRDLFAYVDLNPEEEPERFAWLVEQVKSLGFDPEYYVKPDSTSDLPYDFYRPGEKSTKKPIYLEMPSGEIRELSEQSHIVSAMANNIKVDYKVYYPKEIMFI